MKRNSFIITLLPALLLAVTSCSEVKIFLDSTSSEGERKILTSGVDLVKIDEGKIQIGLGLKVSEKDTLAALVFACETNVEHGIFNQGNVLQFRLSDQSEITLVNLLDKKFKSHQETHVTEHYETNYGCYYAYGPRSGRVYVRPYQVNELVPEVYTTQSNYSFALYLVTLDELNRLTEKGVIKMRIETEDHEYDFSGSQTADIPQKLMSLRACMKERALQKKEHSEF